MNGLRKSRKIVFRDQRTGKRIVIGKSIKNMRSFGESEKIDVTDEIFTPDCGHSFISSEEAIGIGQCSVCNRTICLAYCFEQCERCNRGICKSRKCSKVWDEKRYCRSCFRIVLAKKAALGLFKLPFKVLLSPGKKY